MPDVRSLTSGAMIRTLAILLAGLLASCAGITEKLDKYALKREVMDKVLADVSHTAFALSAAFTAADTNQDDEVRGLEWIEFVRTAIEQFKDIRGMVELNPVTLEALQQVGVTLDEPLLAVEGAIKELKTRSDK